MADWRIIIADVGVTPEQAARVDGAAQLRLLE